MTESETGATVPELDVRLVATDLDGTLLRADGTVSERTRRVVGVLEAAGIPVVFVTARPLRWMGELWPMVGEHGLAVLSNGAILYDVAERAVLELHGIEADLGLRLCAAVSEALPAASFALECLSGIRRDPRFLEPRPVPPGSRVGPLAEIWDEPAVKVMVRCPGVDPGELRAAVTAAVGDLATPTWSVEDLVEISARGVTKASGLQRVCSRLGVPASAVLAFGDMPNDLPMLAWAGTSYAVANAHPTVREAVDRIAPDHDDDGVARVLEALVLRRTPG